MNYSELQITSNFTFLRGASNHEEFFFERVPCKGAKKRQVRQEFFVALFPIASLREKKKL